MSKKLKNIGIVSALTVVSRFLGLARDTLSAAIFGAGAFMDAFVTAYSLPNLFRRLLGEGALTSAFVPTLQEELRDRGRPGAFVLLSQVTSWLFVVTGVCVVLGMIVFTAGGAFSGDRTKWGLAADLTVLLFPYLLFVCLAAAFSAALNVLERFTEPALSPVWLNLAIIASLAGAYWQGAGLHWLCAGVLVGGWLQMVVPAVVLTREGWRPAFDLTFSPRVRAIGLLMAPAILGTAVYQVNIYVSRVLAFSVSEASATLLFYANRLMELPIGVFAIAVATVVYPLLSRHAAEGNRLEMAADYHKGLRLILAINVPAAVGLAVLCEPITRLIFEHGNFTADMTAAMAPLLAGYALGMPFFAVSSLTTRSFYALKDTRTPVKMAALSFAVNLGLSLLLMHRFDAMGLVLASTVAVVVQVVLLQRVLVGRLPEMSLRALWPGIGKVIVASMIMGVVTAAGWWLLRQNLPSRRAADVVAIFVLIPVAAGLYAGLFWAWRIEGRNELATLLRGLRGKFGGKAKP